MEKQKFGTLQEVAEYAKTLFVHHEKTEESNAFYSFKSEVIGAHDPVEEALSDSMHLLAENMDEDSVYEYTVETIDHVINGDLSDEEDIYESVDSDTDVYTSDLTEWLNRSNKNVGYLTEALEESDVKDGFKALQIAQLKAREEVYSEIFDTLSDLVDEDESSEDEPEE